MSANNFLGSLKKRFSSEKHEKSGYIRWKKRIPEALLERAKAGEYQRQWPYPVEHMIGTFSAEPFVTPTMRIVTMGSCFAEELYLWLKENNYDAVAGDWGRLYTPKSIAQIMRYSFEPDSWQPSELFWIKDGEYLDPYRSSTTRAAPASLGVTPNEAHETLHRHYVQSAEWLRQADLVVWTLGLTESWRRKQDHYEFNQIPYPGTYDPENHEFYNLTYADVQEALEYSYQVLTKVNPDVRILVSVSPVPLSISFRTALGPYVATQYSKSVLHVASMTFVEKYSNVFYMPSYEITRNNPGINYKEDGRHVTKQCVATIMTAFSSLYVVDRR